MKVMPIEKTGITTSRLVLGCMGFGGDWNHSPYSKEDMLNAEKAIDAALANDITMFDHADIYRRGKAEKYLVRF